MYMDKQQSTLRACLLISWILLTQSSEDALIKALKYANRHTNAFTQDLLQLAAIPSVSSLPGHKPDVQKAAKWLKGRVIKAGLKVGRLCRLAENFSPAIVL
jgi:hypothetical protein